MNIDIKQVIMAAEKGGTTVSKYFGEILEIEEKSNASDFRTKADIESETVILDILKKVFTDFNILFHK